MGCWFALVGSELVRIARISSRTPAPMLITPAIAEVVLKPSKGTKMKPLAKAPSADPSELIE